MEDRTSEELAKLAERAAIEREHREFVKKVKESHAGPNPTVEPLAYDPHPKTKKCRCEYCKV